MLRFVGRTIGLTVRAGVTDAVAVDVVVSLGVEGTALMKNVDDAVGVWCFSHVVFVQLGSGNIAERSCSAYLAVSAKN